MGNIIFVVYVDDEIFESPPQTEINKSIAYPKSAKCIVEDGGTLADYIGVNIQSLPDGSIKLNQPIIIDQIISYMHPYQ